MITTPFEEIDKATIDRLVADQTPENHRLDYKSTFPSGNDKSRKEFAADVSSFANSGGGCLVYGVIEGKTESGARYPKEAAGCSFDPDQDIQRLDQWLQSNISPPIPGVRLKPIHGFRNGSVLLVWIPKSLQAPHMVSIGDSRFFGRGGASRFGMTVDQIRYAFDESGRLAERVRQFREKRLSLIRSEHTPVRLNSSRLIALHIVPLTAAAVDVTQELGGQLNPLRGSANDRSFNLDGHVVYDWEDPTLQAGYTSYTQLFRNGSIETVETPTLGKPDGIPFLALEQRLISAVVRYSEALKSLGVSPPVAVLLSMLKVRGLRVPSALHEYQPDYTINSDELVFPDVTLNSFEKDDVPCALRPLADMLWQSMGRPRSQSYSESGEYLGQ